MIKRSLVHVTFGLVFLLVLAGSLLAENTNKSKFRQLKQEFSTPNVYRTASGAPGHEYWQQQADYKIDVVMDDKTQRIDGKEAITYCNQSPDTLKYIWLQLDQNMRALDSDSRSTAKLSIENKQSFRSIRRLHNDFDGGFKIESITDSQGRDLSYVVVQTMMRIDLPEPIAPGDEFTFNIAWWYNINNRKKDGGRSGYEYFEEDENYLYTIAQFYPRMAVYNEVEGWQHKQFLGAGEFTLPFGNFEVAITVPSDHVVGATGLLQNEKEVLTSEQINRLRSAVDATDPVMIVNPDEALAAEGEKAEGTKTWKFKADNVRDFAFASSRKFIWDALGVKFGDRTVLAMSYYPKEGNPLWEQYSTKVVAHTLKTYSKFTFDYPYPVAISVHTDRIGMEYPMICFNGGRPEKDGTYSKSTKYGMISVIIHEVGHNFFPMIVNSDERQWTWMDEGLNTFLQYLSEQEWEHDYPSRRGPAYKITDYMKGDKSQLTPIMTNSESLFNFGSNAYAKPCTALNILRETVLGRELFDFSFKEYSRRWMFKHPSPEDFFRTMEDASGVDLDWFWRGWFYTTDYVDIDLASVELFQVDTENPEIEKPFQKKQEEEIPEFIGHTRNIESITTWLEKDQDARDFYDTYDPFEITILDKEKYEKFYENLTDEEKGFLDPGWNYYQLTFVNKGGLVMPLILKFEYEDGTEEVKRIPAEIWLKAEGSLTKVFPTEKTIRSIEIDPFLETADTDRSNNYWPARVIPTKFQMFKQERKSEDNPMQDAAKILEMEKEDSKSEVEEPR
jgi:Peptidase family M1 domain